MKIKIKTNLNTNNNNNSKILKNLHKLTINNRNNSLRNNKLIFLILKI